MRRLLIVLLIVLGLAVAADRVSLVLAERAVARQIRSDLRLPSAPDVTLDGFPFLTQAVRGRYDGGRVVVAGLDWDRLRVQRLVVRLTGVHVGLSDVLSRSLTGVPVDRLAGSATVRYGDLAAATRVPGLRLAGQGGRLRLTVPVGQGAASVNLAASARVAVEGDGLRITDVRASAAGVPLPQAVVDAALRPVEQLLPLGTLPYGLHLTGVRIEPGGLAVAAAGRNAVLRG